MAKRWFGRPDGKAPQTSDPAQTVNRGEQQALHVEESSEPLHQVAREYETLCFPGDELNSVLSDRGNWFSSHDDPLNDLQHPEFVDATFGWWGDEIRGVLSVKPGIRFYPQGFSIETIAPRVPPVLRKRCGQVFLSGRMAFSQPSPLYVLGLHPHNRSDRSSCVENSVDLHSQMVLQSRGSNWSAFRDGSWSKPGHENHEMAARMLHLFKGLALNPGLVPCSNLFFLTRRCMEHGGYDAVLLRQMCWSFHIAVLDLVQPKAILCLGSEVGGIVRNLLNAHDLTSQFLEPHPYTGINQVFRNGQGLFVAVVTDPQSTDWTHPFLDPTELVAECLE